MDAIIISIIIILLLISNIYVINRIINNLYDKEIRTLLRKAKVNNWYRPVNIYLNSNIKP